MLFLITNKFLSGYIRWGFFLLQRPSLFMGPQSFPGSARFNMANLWDSLRSFISSPVTVRHDDDLDPDNVQEDDDVFPAKCWRRERPRDVVIRCELWHQP